jgi:hypothetical protein
VAVFSETSHLSSILQVPLSSLADAVAMAMTVGSSSLSPGGMEPLPKAYFGALMRVSAQYVCGATCCLHGS